MFEKLKIKRHFPKVGDKVMVSRRNPNHLGTNVSAYAGFSGIISEVFKDDSFCIFSGQSTLVVPLEKREKYYVFINGVEFYIKLK